MMRIRLTAATAAALSCLGFLHSPVLAQGWPSRPLTMVVTYAAGGTTDIVGRIIGTRLSEILKQQVVVENIGGAGGMTGAARVAEAPPDGYTFVIGNVGTHDHNQTIYKTRVSNATTD